MNYRLGENAVLYYNATPVTVVPASMSGYGVAANVQDVKAGGSNDQPEYTTRANNGIKQYATSLADLSISFKYKVPARGVSDPAYIALRSAWIGKTEIALGGLTDTDANSGEGPAGNFTIGKWEIDESNGKVLFVDIEAKPSSFNCWYPAGDGSYTGSF